MRLPFIPIILALLVSILLDYYIWRALRNRLKSRWPATVQLISAALLNVALIVAIALPRRDGSNEVLLTDMWLIFTCMSFFIPKAIWAIFDLISRIGKWRPLRLLSYFGGLLAVALFAVLWWGALIGRTSLDVEEVTVDIPDLPEAFDGYRIALFSDLHTGSYGSDTTFVSKVVSTINETHPDIILFTGDIVNRNSHELEPFVAPLSRLKAPDGVFAILGNHDYGDYTDWPSPQAKAENMEVLSRLFPRMGWKLLRDSTAWITQRADSLAIIGVENIGDPPFPTYGSLEKAYPNVGDSHTKILLSHNPKHWSDSISARENINIALTLAGHTHAMQMEVANWSPACFRYPLWGGLYGDPADCQLFVNIGIGVVGFPARLLQATPSITLITLHRTHN